MLCYCNCCHHVFKSTVFRCKNQIPAKCPYCKRKIWKNQKGEKVPAVRIATKIEEKRYNQELSYILDAMDDKDEWDGY